MHTAIDSVDAFSWTCGRAGSHTSGTCADLYMQQLTQDRRVVDVPGSFAASKSISAMTVLDLDPGPG